MRNFFHLLQAFVSELPLRPLLYTAGTAAATVSMYYFICKEGMKTDADPEEESATEDSGSRSEVAHDQATVPAAPCTEERERDQMAHDALQLQHKEITKKLQHCKELLCSSLDQVREKHQKAVESFINLQFEKSNLMKDVQKLKGRFQDMGSQTCETQKKPDEIWKNETELKYQEAQLDIENLKKYVETLRGTIQDIQILMYETQIKHNQERERDRKAHDTLQLNYEETMKKLQHCNELLWEGERERVAYRNLSMEFTYTNINAVMKSSLDQVWEKQQKPLDRLQFENSNLMKEVETLKSTVQDMGTLIYETQKKQDEEYERLFQAYSTLHLEREQMKKSLNRCEQLLMEYETEREAHRYLTFEHRGMIKTLKHTEELLKVALAEAMGKHRRGMKSIAILECSLIDKSETLQNKVQKMGSLISETQKKHDEEFDPERQAHNILQSVVEKFHHCEELRGKMAYTFDPLQQTYEESDPHR